jgi:hypothetical protein
MRPSAPLIHTASKIAFMLLAISAGVTAISHPVLAIDAGPTSGGHLLCENGTHKAETSEQIPNRLLAAISLRETGRWAGQQKRSLSWPWTVTVKGRGHYMASKGEAIAFVRRLQAENVRNIDVGCMQVNLKYHPHAFANLHAAFDPHGNTLYAAKFLSQLREDHGSWQKAIRYYHSNNAKRGAAYQDSVYQLWHNQETARASALRSRAARQAEQQAALIKQRQVAAINKQKKAAEKAARRAAYEAHKAAYIKKWQAQRAARKTAKPATRG